MNREVMSWAVAFLGRHLFCTICTVVTLLAGGVSAYLLQDAGTLEGEYQALSRDGEVMLATLKMGPTLRQELTEVRDAVRRLEANLVDRENIAVNYEYFHGFEQRTQARLEDLQQLSPATGAATIYQRVPFSLRVSGSYAQVHAYLYAIESGPRLANITSATFRRLPRSESTITLEMNLELLGKL